MADQPPRKSPFQPVPPRRRPPSFPPPKMNSSQTQANTLGIVSTNPFTNAQPSGQTHGSPVPPGSASKRKNVSPVPATSKGIPAFRSAPASAIKRQLNAQFRDSTTTTDLSLAFPLQMVPQRSETERAYRMTTPEDFKGMCEDLRTFMNLNVHKVPHQIVKLFRTTLMLVNRYSIDDARDFAFNCNQLFMAHFDKKRARINPGGLNEHVLTKRTRHSAIRGEGTITENSPLVRGSEIEPERFVSRIENSQLVQAVNAMVQESNPAWAPRGASPEPEVGMVVQQKKENAAFQMRVRSHKQMEVIINTKMAMSKCPWDDVPIDKNDRYVLWDVNESGVVPAARLQRTVAQKLETMLDIHHQLHSSQARLLRYLWTFLVAEPIRGTVLCGAMGALRMQQVFAFAAIYMAERRQIMMQKTGSPPRILVIVPKDCENEWAEHISLHNTGRAVVIPNKTSRTNFDTLDDWKSKGGVLVCAETFYYTSLYKKTDKQNLCRELLCNPGPDVVFLDQASRFPIMKKEVRRLLYRTKTKARVALTGVSIGGNLGSMWYMLNWVYPGLLGDIGEFRDMFEKRILRGHFLESSLADGNEAYRRASSLFTFAHPVIFPSFGLYDFDKYFSRCVEIDSITVNTNMYPYQREIYVQLQRYFSKVVPAGEISAFVAGHILLVTGTSIHALKKLLEQGVDFRHRCIASKRLEKPLERLEPMFKRLHDRIGDIKRFGAEHKIKGSPKFVIARHFFKQCVERREKMVVFTGSQEVLVALVDFLASTQRQGGHVSCWNPAESYALRVRNVKEFRDFNAAAVLVAPYGPTVECRETMGWADLKVSKVIIMDSGWHSVAEAQCVKRIESRLLGHNGRRVQVVNLIASGTFESMQYMNVLRIYDEERTRLRNTQNMNPQFENPSQRSFLIQPEIDPTWFTREPHRQKHGVVDTDEITQKVNDYCRANTTIDFGKMVKLKITPECNVVRGITAKYNRVLAVACFAEMCTRAPLHELELRKAKTEMMAGFERYSKHEEELAEGMSSYRGVKKTRDGMVELINAKSECEELPSFPGLEPHQLLTANWLPALWESYYDMYEGESARGRGRGHGR